MSSARELRPADRNARYKLKEVDIPAIEVGRGVPPMWVIKALEEHHEEGWEVCGVSMAAGGQAIWIFYRRLGRLN